MFTYAYITAFIAVVIVLLYLRKRVNTTITPPIQVITKDDTRELLKGIKEIVESTKEKVVLKPEPINKRYRVLINSAERDKTLYPSVSDYWVKLPEPVFGLKRIQMIDASFPTTLELINDNNNTLNVTIGGAPTIYTVPLVNGYYNGTELATMIQTALNDFFVVPNPVVTFTVTYNKTTGILTITSVTQFTLTGNEYLNGILGLTTSVPTGTYTLSGTQPVNVSYAQNILVDISNESYDFNSLQIMQKNENNIKCFAFVPLPSGNGYGGFTPSASTISGSAILVESASSTSGYGTFSFHNAYYEAWEGVIPRVQLLHIQLKNLLPSNDLVSADFNNADHTIELEFTARLDKSSQHLC